MRDKIEETIESVVTGDMSSERYLEELTGKLDELFNKHMSHMHWKKIKEQDEGSRFTVHFMKELAQNKSGVKMNHHSEGIMVQMPNGTEFIIEWEEIMDDLKRAIEKDDIELALED